MFKQRSSHALLCLVGLIVLAPTAADGATTLRPRDGEAQAYHLGLKLSAVGFGELQAVDRPQRVSADEFTVSYQ